MFILHASDTTAVCTPECGEHGRCTRPNYCTCSTGYGGHRCEEGEKNSLTKLVKA